MEPIQVLKACGHTFTPKATCEGFHPCGPWCLAIEDPYSTVGRCWTWYCSAHWSMHFGHSAPVEAITSDMFSALILERGYEPRGDDQ